MNYYERVQKSIDLTGGRNQAKRAINKKGGWLATSAFFICGA